LDALFYCVYNVLMSRNHDEHALSSQPNEYHLKAADVGDLDDLDDNGLDDEDEEEEDENDDEDADDNDDESEDDDGLGDGYSE
jgi:hypothetical protein